MHTIAVSDLHLGWEESNPEEFKKFLDEKVKRESPDKFILIGDIYEMWRRGLISVTMEFSEITAKITEISNQGTEVVPIAAEYKDRADRVVSRINKKYDEFVLFGHTHLPAITEDYANCGSWTGKENTFVEIKDEEVQLRTWN